MNDTMMTLADSELDLVSGGSITNSITQSIAQALSNSVSTGAAAGFGIHVHNTQHADNSALLVNVVV